jgi:hypothetical protein
LGAAGWRKPVTLFLEKFACRSLYGVNLTMLDSLANWNPFARLWECDSNRAVRPSPRLPAAVILCYTVHVNPTTAHHRQQVTGFWIAFADDRETVLGKGKTAEEALKKNPVTLILTHLVEDDEIPNDDLIAAMKEAEEEDRKGKLKFYSTVEEFMASLE